MAFGVAGVTPTESSFVNSVNLQDIPSTILTGLSLEMLKKYLFFSPSPVNTRWVPLLQLFNNLSGAGLYVSQ